MHISKHLMNHEEREITEERRRIARDLHDGVIQQFAHVLHKLEFIEHLLEAQKRQLPSTPQMQVMLDEIGLAYGQQKAALDELRKYMMVLLSTPNPLANPTLSSLAATSIINMYMGSRESGAFPKQGNENRYNAWEPMKASDLYKATVIGWSSGLSLTPLSVFVEEFRQQNPQIELSYIDEKTYDMTTALLVPVFRVVQEALNNVQKHAQAKHVMVRICMLSHSCLVEIGDDGVGFQVNTSDASSNNGMGLRIMRERTQEAGGEWTVYSAPEKGTMIRALFPL